MFMVEQRSLAEYCSFGVSLEKMVWDRLVCGVNEEGIQRKLLAEENLTYEAASTKVKVKPVHAAQSQGASNNFELLCDCCGSPEHLARLCLFKDAMCHKCRKTGHLAKVCRSQRKTSVKPSKPRKSAVDRLGRWRRSQLARSLTSYQRMIPFIRSTQRCREEYAIHPSRYWWG